MSKFQILKIKDIVKKCSITTNNHTHTDTDTEPETDIDIDIDIDTDRYCMFYMHVHCI